MLLNGRETIQKLIRRVLGLEHTPPAIEHQPEIEEPTRLRPSRIILRAKAKKYEVQDVLNGLGRDKNILRNIKKMPDREKVKLVKINTCRKIAN